MGRRISHQPRCLASSSKTDSFGEIIEKRWRPKLEFAGVGNEYPDFIGSFFEIDVGESSQQQFLERSRVDRFAVPMSSLAHACVEMGEIWPDVSAHVPDEVIEIATFDSAFPSAAEHGMEFAGKKTFKVIEGDLIRAG